MMWYCYDLAAGRGEMRLTYYEGLAEAYAQMITQCAGASVGYVNKAKTGAVGASLDGTPVLY